MEHIELYTQECTHCLDENEPDPGCAYCHGTGAEVTYYRRYCNYESRHDCEWRGDCRFCLDSEEIVEY